MNGNKLKVRTMKAEKVTITSKEKAKPVDGWNPNEESLPQQVRENLDKWLTHDERKYRQKVVAYALIGMVRDRQAAEYTTTLYLSDGYKNIIEKPFTFYKTRRQPHEQG